MHNAIRSLPSTSTSGSVAAKLKPSKVLMVAGIAASLTFLLHRVSADESRDYPVQGPPFFEQRNEVAFRTGPYNTAFFHRHNESFRYSAAFHFQHGKEHDLLQTTRLADHEAQDAKDDPEFVDFTVNKRAYTEPTMDLYGPFTDQFAHRVYRAIDWTHQHHEQTYDILSDAGIAWADKKAVTDAAVRYYLQQNKDVARSIAPLDITMRRAAVMMKPYFTLFRNYYPRSQSYTYVAHWWHPAAYECMMLAGNGPGQEANLAAMNRVMVERVFKHRPGRMLLSREMMPRYARMSPESANIFDNLHMLHGIVYDILAYDKWTPAEKRAELYRFIDAMSYHPGDEKYVRKFRTPYPDTNPRVYAAWMESSEGEMTRIMKEMMMEMMPMMMPGGMTPAMHKKMMAQMAMKMRLGLEPGELPGSLHDAMMAMMPGMKMMPGSMEPGKTPQMMVDAMLKGWEKKYGNLPDIAPLPMDREPQGTSPAVAANR